MYLKRPVLQVKSFVLIVLIIVSSIWNNARGQFYVCTGNMEFVKLDFAACNNFFIGTTDSVMYDIAITPDNDIYGIDGFHYLYKINPLNASFDTILPITNVSASTNSLVSDELGNLFTVADSNVYKINRLTGQAISMGYIGPYNSAGDLTFYNGSLYMATTSSELLKIRLYPTVGSQVIGTLNATHIFGINTVCMNNVLIMVASGLVGNYSSIYQVNHLNASLTLLCDSIIDESIYGAASEDDFNPKLNCISNNLNNFSEKINFLLFPNPANTFLNISTTIPEPLEIILFDIDSKKLLKQKFINSTTLNIENFAEGIYFYQIQNKEGIIKKGKWLKIS